MPDTPSEPFHVVLRHLRARLQLGVLPPGAHITAVDLADELGLSTTPVREALSRVAGEGLLEDRRGQGYFVRLLSGADIADLYRLSLAHLLFALEPRRPRRATDAGEGDARPEASGDAVADVEDLFRRWIGTTGSRLLIRSFRIVEIQLGPVRRLEAGVIEAMSAEAAQLLASDASASRAEHLAQLRHFHAARIRESDRLAALLEASAARPGK